MAVDTETDPRVRQRTERQAPGADSTAARTEGVGERGRAQAEAIWNDAKTSVRSTLSEKQRSTAAELADFANALRGAARNVNQRGPVVQAAERAADGLERLSGKLRGKDLDGLIHDVESFARSQPAVFLGMAVAAGFLAVRFLKSTSPESSARLESGPTGFTPAGPRPDLDAMAGATPDFNHDPRST